MPQGFARDRGDPATTLCLMPPRPEPPSQNVAEPLEPQRKMSRVGFEPTTLCLKGRSESAWPKTEYLRSFSLCAYDFADARPSKVFTRGHAFFSPLPVQRPAPAHPPNRRPATSSREKVEVLGNVVEDTGQRPDAKCGVPGKSSRECCPRSMVVKRRWLPVCRVVRYPSASRALARSSPETSLGSLMPRSLRRGRSEEIVSPWERRLPRSGIGRHLEPASSVARASIRSSVKIDSPRARAV